MRLPRVTGAPGQSNVYLVSTRVLRSARMFGGMERNVFLRGLFKGAEFSGIEVLTYCLGEDEVRLLVRVPDKRSADATVDDTELQRRLVVLYGEPETEERWKTLQTENRLGERGRYLARMHDLGLFMKEVKLRYSKWANRRSARTGTAWEERFQSTLIDGDDRRAVLEAAREVERFAEYQGLAKSARLWPWCGAFMATRGTRAEAIAGVCLLMGAPIEDAEYAIARYAEWVCDEVPRMPSGRPKRNRGAEWEEGIPGMVPRHAQGASLIAGAIVYGAGAFVDMIAERSQAKSRASGMEGRSLLKKARERPRRR